MDEQDIDVQKAREMLIDEDFDGGFHNIQPPPEFYENAQREAEEAESFIIMNDGAGEIPYKVDGVNVTFTPEELVLLTEILELFSTETCSVVPYAGNELNMSLYEQQGKVRQLRDIVDGTLDHYVRVRPFTPFLVPWLRKIGKDKIRKGGE